MFVQHLYGIRIRTPWPIAGVRCDASGLWDVEFVEGTAESFAEAARYVPLAQADWWAQYAALPDGSRYRRWTNLFEFLVAPDARRIQARALTDANQEAFQAYLLVEGLSFSMVRLGREPLHATAVQTDRGVVAFLGDSGFGKSTLGALLIHGGCRMLTDDMLVLTEERDTFVAHPGPPRIKLYREIADRIFGDDYCGVPMNPSTEKLIVPLKDEQRVTQAAPLGALYLIGEGNEPSDSAVLIRSLSPAQAFPRVLAHTVSHWAHDPARIENQFHFVTRLVQQVPIKTLSYARDRNTMFSVRDAVLKDATSGAQTTRAPSALTFPA